MSKVTIVCDRCSWPIDGIWDEECTGGFYTRSGGWGKYMHMGEYVVCDDCVWQSPAYIADYGKVGSPPCPACSKRLGKRTWHEGPCDGGSSQ